MPHNSEEVSASDLCHHGCDNVQRRRTMDVTDTYMMKSAGISVQIEMVPSWESKGSSAAADNVVCNIDSRLYYRCHALVVGRCYC